MGDSSKIVETATYQYEANTIIAEGIIEGAINKTSLEEIGKHENIDENSDVQVTHTKKAEEDAYPNTPIESETPKSKKYPSRRISRRKTIRSILKTPKKKKESKKPTKTETAQNKSNWGLLRQKTLS